MNIYSVFDDGLYPAGKWAERTSHLFPDTPLSESEYPLSCAVWREIEKCYPGETRKDILSNHNWKFNSIKPVFLHRNLPGEIAKPIEFKSNNKVLFASLAMTELMRFIERVWQIDDHATKEPSLQAAIDAVNLLGKKALRRTYKHYEILMPIAENLYENIDFLQKNRESIGRFAIIADKCNPYKIKRFADVEAFNEEFMRLAIPDLQQGRIPVFEFSITPYDYLVSEITNLSNTIAKHLKEPELISLFHDTYNFAMQFERAFYMLYDSDIIDRANYRKTRRNGAKVKNEQKQNCYSRMKLAAGKIAQEHPTFSISQAADKLSTMFPVCTKIIKEQCKVELAPLNKKSKK